MTQEEQNFINEYNALCDKHGMQIVPNMQLMVQKKVVPVVEKKTSKKKK